jgi:hypothetical protein
MSLEDIRGEVSLVISVVGHRDLADQDRVRAAISAFLGDLDDKYRYTDLLVITGMAEGADCLAAEAAIEKGIKYFAVLPFEEEAYLSTFRSAESANRARELIGKTTKIVLPAHPKNCGADFYHDEAAQKLQYEALAAFLVEASQILLAIYDLKPTGLQGGTSDAIDFKLGKKPLPGLEECSGLNNAGVGPVHYVVATRKSHQGPPLPIVTKSPDYPVYRADANAASYEAAYQLQDDFNRDVSRGNAEKLKVKRSRDLLYPNIDQARGSHTGMDWTGDRFAWADALAQENQRIANVLWNGVFVLLGFGVAAVVPLHVFHELNHNRVLEICYYMAVFVAFVLGFWEYKMGYRRRYEDYRALAEALRVQYFWLASGLPKMVSEFYLSKQTGELGWVRDTMSEVLLASVEANAATRSIEMDQAGIAAAITWITEQKGYFERKRKKWRGLASLCRQGSLIAFVVAFVLQVSVMVWFHLDEHFHWGFQQIELVEEWIRAATTILIGWSVLIGSYGELNSYGQLERQYETAHRVFSLAGELLQHDADAEEAGRTKAHEHARQVIEELGKSALHESGDWFMMHRERKLDITLV